MKNRSLKTLLNMPAKRNEAAASARVHKAAPQPAPFVIRAERASDVSAREHLLDRCFGANRHARTCSRLRDGRLPAQGLAFAAIHKGRVAGTVRLWHVVAGGVPALMLGPLAVDPSLRNLGIGAALMQHALSEAARLGHGAIILLGDAPYYARFGFSAAKAARLVLPGPFERDRLLGCEFRRGALNDAAGLIRASGLRAPVPASPAQHAAAGARHAA